jgi:hypothetical protein
MMVRTPRRAERLELRLAAVAMSLADRSSRWMMDLYRWGIVGRVGTLRLFRLSAWLRRVSLRLILRTRRRR